MNKVVLSLSLVSVSAILWVSVARSAYALPTNNITLAGINFTAGERPYYENGKLAGITLPIDYLNKTNYLVNKTSHVKQVVPVTPPTPIPRTITPTVNSSTTTPIHSNTHHSTTSHNTHHSTTHTNSTHHISTQHHSSTTSNTHHSHIQHNNNHSSKHDTHRSSTSTTMSKITTITQIKSQVNHKP